MLTKAQFLKYDSENPQVWETFEEFALQVVSSRNYFGAKAVMERVRWFAYIESKDQFKVNNNWTAFYVRKFAAKYPQYNEFFRVRNSYADWAELTREDFDDKWKPKE